MEEIGLINELIGLSYGGIFLLALSANMIAPVPEEVILIVTGYVVGKGHFDFGIITIIFFVGMFISDTVLFYLAKSGTKYVQKMRKSLNKNRYLRDDSFVVRHIRYIIVISRFLVYFRWIGPVLSGTTKIKYKTFAVWDALALAIYVPLVLFLGNYFQARIDQIIEGISRFKNVFFLVVVVGAIVILANVINKSFWKKITKPIHKYKKTIVPGISVKNENKDEVNNTQKKED